MACSSSSPKLPLLSSGSISRILNEELIDHAILQILGYKIVPGSGIERFRLLLNDGETLFPFALLSTQLNYLIETRKLEKFTILKLCKYVSTPILPDKKIILCLEVKPLVPGSIVKDQIYSKTNQSNLCNILNEEQETQPIIQEIPTEESASLINDYHSCKLNNSHVPQNELNSHFGKNTYNSRNIDQPSTSGTSLNTKKDRLSGQYNNQMFNINCNNQKSFLNTQTISQSTLAVIPITSLTPYQNKWAIKARVVYKTSVKKYSNAKGSGLLFTFFLLDETGEIRVTAFDKQAELLHSFLQLNRVYYVSNAKVLLARNNSPVKNDFEITVNANTNIELADDTSTIPNLEFNFVSISEIFKMPKDSYVDVIGVCCNISEMMTIVTKANKEVHKVDLLLIDFDKKSITVSLWGSDAEGYKSQENHVIAIKRAKITDFRGCCLTVSPDSMFFVEPPMSEARILQSWYENLGDSSDVKLASSQSLSEWKSQTWKTCADIFSTNLENSDKVEYFTIKATMTEVQKEMCLYKACPLPDCYKKVVDLNNSFYKCPKCDKEYDSFKWILVLSFNLADFSGSLWSVAFREVAESIIGEKTEVLSSIREENEDRYLNILSTMHFKSFIFKLRSKVEVNNETSHLKTTVLDAKPVNEVLYTKKLLSDIERFKRILKCK